MLNFTQYAESRRKNPAMEELQQQKHLHQSQLQPSVQPQPATTEVPKIGVDAIGDLNKMLGPSPEEREAEFQQQERHRQKMQGWASAFNGLRHLSNLYFTSKGASPQQYGNVNAQVDQQIDGHRQRVERLRQANQQYYKNMYDMQRQAAGEQRKAALNQAQVNYYGTRDEMARLKGENDRLKAEAQAQLTEARRKSVEAKAKQLEELHPLQKRKLEAVIKNTLHNANRPYSTGRGGGGSNRATDFEEFANNWHDDPDTFGPIMQAEGLGFYDKESKEFTFTKNPNSANVRIANQKQRRQRKTSGRDSNPQRSTDIRKSKTQL